MSIWLNRLIAIAFPGRERTGSGATSDSCRTMTRSATTAWCARRYYRAHRSPPRTSIPFRPKGLALTRRPPPMKIELKSFYGAERLDPRSTAVRCKSSWAGPDGHTASLFPGNAVLAERDKWVCRRRWRQARSAHHADLSGAREQPACGLPNRGRREAADLQAASPWRRQPAGSASSSDRHVVDVCRCGRERLKEIDMLTDFRCDLTDRAR